MRLLRRGSHLLRFREVLRIKKIFNGEGLDGILVGKVDG